tara:strand:- start:3849 stop:4058 length:210 start_codon:yes stop_codon:yes gene_type:complete
MLEKLYEYEFTVTEVIDYVIKVKATNLVEADDKAMDELNNDNDKWRVNAYTDNWECTYDEKEFLEENQC